MTPLRDRIAGQILTDGPMPVATYMALCLFDPAHGYYTTRQPFGRDGDFTTAPEISQMFGELLGVWLVQVWRALGRPSPVAFAEIGPGRGTLARDLLRTVDRLEPGMRTGASFHLIEVSPKLKETQAATLAGAGWPIHQADSLDGVPAGQPLFIVGNELFDAIPARQFVKTASGWRERCIGLGEAGNLAFVAGAGSIDASLLPPAAAGAANGSIFELAPAREALMQTIAGRIARDGGAGLFLDYGHLAPGLGDTLQALRGHAHADPLAHPGEADLTTHVDFAALAAVVRAAGLNPFLTIQGQFLVSLGLLERAGVLGAKADDATRARLTGEVDRLACPDAMGNLFKVLAFSAADSLPGF